MQQAVMLINFKLAKGAAVPDFLQAAEKVNREFISKQKGFISWKQLVDGDKWADLITWETMADAHNAMMAAEGSAGNSEFWSFLDMESVNMQFFTVERSY